MGTNLTKIESRPVQGKPWEYIFYVDCQIQSAEEGGRALRSAEAALRHGEGTGPLPGSHASINATRQVNVGIIKRGWI